MLTVSLHGIKINAPNGLYPEERIVGNDFEIDVDILLNANDTHAWPFVDYTFIRSVVVEVFQQPDQLLEDLVRDIYSSLRIGVPDAQKIKVVVRKLNPPMQGEIRHAQVGYEA